MRIIAIETSGRHGSVAALRGEDHAAICVNQVLLPVGERTAASLAPALRDMLHQVGWPARSIDLICVASGPGSFTGLRIGVTTAKTLAYAVGAVIIGVDTLEVLAAQASAPTGRLWPIIDAQRHELFTAAFDVPPDGPPRRVSDTVVIKQDQWLAELRSGDRVTGPALRTLAARLPTGILAVAEELWQPTATAAGQVGWRAYQAGQRDDVWKLLPQYHRLSAAEEKLKHPEPSDLGRG